MTLFDKCILVLLDNEKGYQCDPDDSGNWTDAKQYNIYIKAKEQKPFDPELVKQIIEDSKRLGILRGTKYGISARAFPKIDIKNLTEDQAKTIYYEYYWHPMNLEQLTDELLVLHIFDHGVNCGKRTSIRMLQRLVDAKADGVIGPDTLRRANTTKMPTSVINGYGMLTTLCEYFIYARYGYYTRLIKERPALKKYLKGWYNRIDNTHF